MTLSKPAVAIVPRQNQVLIGTSEEQQSYSYSDSQLSKILQEPTTVKVFADAVVGQNLLNQNGLKVGGQIFDVKLADSLLTAGLEVDNSIASISSRHLGKFSLESLPQDLLKLRDVLRVKLASEELIEVAKIEFNATKATAQMSQNGVRLDTAWLKDKQQELEEERRGLESQVKDWLGEKLPDETDKIQLSDLTSTKKADKTQTLECFNRAGVPLESFNKNHIQSLTTEHPILNQFQRMRTVNDLIGNKGIQGLLNVVDDENKVYPTWHQNSAATGRMSATKPAIQNIPASLKRAIIPEQQGEEKQVFVRADYSQQELRILAQLTGDKTLTSAYQEGRDAHRLTASLMTGKPENQITSEERQRAKPVNFGKIYGQSPQGLQSYAKVSYGVEFSIEDAMKFQAAMDKGYPSVARHEQQVRQDFKHQWNAALSSEDNQYPQTRTLLGRKREWQPQQHQYPPINEALNAPIQGSGADMSKLALALLPDALQETGAKITLIRHDKIVLTAQESQAEKVGKILESVMKVAGLRITPDIPTVAEVSICDNLLGVRLSEQEFRNREEKLPSPSRKEPITELRTYPKQATKFKPKQQPLSSENTLTDFDIRDHVKFRNGRGECPCCGLEGKPNNLNLSVREDGLFWCFRGSGGEPPSRDVEQLHDEKAIRKALGLPEIGKVQVLPDIREFNQSQSSSDNLTPRVATEEDLKISQQRLLSADDKHHSLQQKALNYLEGRGITPEMAERYNIGLNFGFRTPDGRSLPASITFHHRDAVEPDKLYLRRRYAPWLSEEELEPGTPKWGQSGVPPSVWVVQQPEPKVEKTYLTEGPWDAVRLGEAVRQSGESIAVACTSTGARGIPPPEQLKAIPGEEVVIFYVCEAW